MTNAGYVLLFYLIFGVICFVLGLIPVVGEIVIYIGTGAITLGLHAYYLELARGQQPSFAAYFSGFKDFGRAFVLFLLMTIFIWLWSLLFIIPGIIAGYRYAMAYFIMKDNPGMSPLDAIRASKRMMAGNKGRLFVLYLTFIGWYLLCIPTFGIGLLWLTPYVFVSMAHFYEDLKYNFQQKMAPPPPYSF